MEIWPLTYLILFWDALGRDIDGDELKKFWLANIPDRELENDAIDALVLLWHTAGKKQDRIKSAEPVKQKKDIDEDTPLLTPDSPGGKEEDSKHDGEPVINSCNIDQAALPAGDPPPELNGRYIYGIARGCDEAFIMEGICQAKVYTISYKDISAIIHACLPQPYETLDRSLALTWIRQHQSVLDAAMDRFEGILPMSFDIIFTQTDQADADEVVIKWLSEKYEQISAQLSYLSGKNEYGICVLCAPEQLPAMAKEKNPAIGELAQNIAGMNRGKAYLYKSELQKMIRKGVDEIITEFSSEIKSQLAPFLYEMKDNITGTENTEGEEKLIYNTTVLCTSAQAQKIGEILENFQYKHGLEIRFTGPWPPYSFVKNLD